MDNNFAKCIPGIVAVLIFAFATSSYGQKPPTTPNNYSQSITQGVKQIPYTIPPVSSIPTIYRTSTNIGRSKFNLPKAQYLPFRICYPILNLNKGKSLKIASIPQTPFSYKRKHV